MDELLAILRKFDALRDVPSRRADTVLTSVLPSCPPDLAPSAYPDGFAAPVRRALVTQGIEALYSHQAAGIDRIRAGEDVVLEAPTASGKTLCFNIPLALALLDDPPSNLKSCLVATVSPLATALLTAHWTIPNRPPTAVPARPLFKRGGAAGALQEPLQP